MNPEAQHQFLQFHQKQRTTMSRRFRADKTYSTATRCTAQPTANTTKSVSNADALTAPIPTPTPNPTPTPPSASSAMVDIKVFGSDGPVTIPQGTSALFSWSSKGVIDCGIDPWGNGGTAGSRSVGPFTTPTTVTISIQCSALINNTVVSHAVSDLCYG